jgi:hypothetical protein
VRPSPIFGIDAVVLVVASLAGFALVAFLTRLIGERLLDADRRARSREILGPLTPALAALFSVMAAFTIANEAGYLRTAENVVGAEGSAASRLAWATTSPGVDGAPIRAALSDFLVTSTRVDWSGRAETVRTPPAVARALQRLEGATRRAATAPGVSSAVAGELLTAVDGLSMARRDVVAESTRSIPIGYLLVLGITGAALVANVALLSLSASRRGLALVVGVVVVVGLSLALLIGISAPFMGPLRVGPGAIDRVINDLHDGMFRLAG